jgi:hypothetical protein
MGGGGLARCATAARALSGSPRSSDLEQVSVWVSVNPRTVALLVTLGKGKRQRGRQRVGKPSNGVTPPATLKSPGRKAMWARIPPPVPDHRSSDNSPGFGPSGFESRPWYHVPLVAYTNRAVAWRFAKGEIVTVAASAAPFGRLPMCSPRPPGATGHTHWPPSQFAA